MLLALCMLWSGMRYVCALGFHHWSFKSSSHPCAAQQGEYSILKIWTRLDHIEWRSERVWNGRHVVGANDPSNIHLSICLCIYCSQMQPSMWRNFGTNAIAEGTLSWWYVCVTPNLTWVASCIADVITITICFCYCSCIPALVCFHFFWF